MNLRPRKVAKSSVYATDESYHELPSHPIQSKIKADIGQTNEINLD